MGAKITDYSEADLPLSGDEPLLISQLSTSVTITAATISAQASDNSYNDSANGFVTAGFAAADRVFVAGFTGNVLNNIYVGVIATLAAGKMTISSPEGDVIVDDAAGESVTITKWETHRVPASEIPGSGGLIGVQILTVGSGTYNATTGTKSVVIEGQGPGAGGSGVASPGSGNAGIGASGGCGGYFLKRLTADFDGAAYVVGGKGTGGAAGANDGNNGTADTTFTDTSGSPVIYTAAKGTNNTRSTGVPPFSAVQGNGGAATNGDINITGLRGFYGAALSTTQAYSGSGAHTKFGIGGLGVRAAGANAATAGSNATGYGGGGSGAAIVGTGTAKAGGDGGDGVIYVWEYSSQ